VRLRVSAVLVTAIVLAVLLVPPLVRLDQQAVDLAASRQLTTAHMASRKSTFWFSYYREKACPQASKTRIGAEPWPTSPWWS
jgi:hypothetical protein